MVVSLSFFLISVFFLLGAGSQVILQFFESKPQVIAYLKDEAKLQDIEVLIAKMQSTGKVKKIDYLSKENALNLYKELFKDQPLLLEMVSAKILPASLEISPNSLSSIKELSEMLKRELIIEDVDYEEDVVAALSKFVLALKKVGLVVAGFLLCVAVLNVLVVLGMRISQRKEESEVLKLLGASFWYICSPVYLEGIFYGLVAAIISWGVTYVLIFYATPVLTGFFSGVPLLPIPQIFMLEVLGGLLGLGVAVGFLGSFLAILRSGRSVR